MNGKKAMIKTTGIYARIVGYYRPLAAWNAGKRQEWADRKLLAIQKKV